jgi:2-polyprenyl-3-methyl-5-hydroxy-6-metoxy-1,4-benzoquinol methylase
MDPSIQPGPSVRALSIEEREALTASAAQQDEAHLRGAFEYLNTLGMCTRYGCIAAYIRALHRKRILDIGCGMGALRLYVDEGAEYHGIDISPSAVSRARSQCASVPNTIFTCADVREMSVSETAYDCVVWAGVGRAYGRSAEAPEPGWQEILELANGLLAPGGVLILETIVDYEEMIVPIFSRHTVVSSWQISCLSSSDHPRRIGWVLEGIRRTPHNL